MTHPRNTICLWFNGQAEEAAQFYTSIFPPDSSVGRILRAPGGDYPAGSRGGDILTVEFTVLGVPCLGSTAAPPPSSITRPSLSRLRLGIRKKQIAIGMP